MTSFDEHSNGLRSRGRQLIPPEDPLDRTYFVLSPEAFDQFVEMIENPPEPSEGLRRLMATKSRWESDAE